MILIARLVVVALGLPAAVASFAHAASENGMLPFGPGALGRTGIDAAATGEFVTRRSVTASGFPIGLA